MFDTDVDKVLAKGENLIKELDTAVAKAEVRAKDKQDEIDRLKAEQAELDRKAKRGSVISKRFSALLHVSDEDLANE